MELSERISLIINSLNMNDKEFADSINEQPSWVARVKNGTTKNPEFTKVANIYRVFPQINPNFLMLGEGEVLCEGKSQNVNISQSHNGVGDNSIKMADCEKEVKHLKDLLAIMEKSLVDKERTIQILINK